jgi:hypothetical protein
MSDILKNATTFQLLVELLNDGNAEIIPELQPVEPINIDSLLIELRQRTGMDHGVTFDAWYKWFMEEVNVSTEHDRYMLRLAKESVERQRFYIGRLTKKD